MVPLYYDTFKRPPGGCEKWFKIHWPKIPLLSYLLGMYILIICSQQRQNAHVRDLLLLHEKSHETRHADRRRFGNTYDRNPCPPNHFSCSGLLKTKSST